MGLWYQIMSPFRVSKGPFQFKKYWPKPVINIGKVPATKITENDLLFELSISYGLPATIIFFLTTINILYSSSKKIFSNKMKIDVPYIDRAFWTALFFFLISQLADVQYFDGKISLITWILIAGLKNIILNKDYKTLG